MNENETVRAKIKRLAPVAITVLSVATTAVVLHKYKILRDLDKENILLVMTPEKTRKLLTEGGAYVFELPDFDFIVKAIVHK